MRITYNPIGGEVLDAVFDRDRFTSSNKFNLATNVFEIDEVDENRDICVDIYRVVGKLDTNQQGKYYILNDELYVRDGWMEVTQ